MTGTDRTRRTGHGDLPQDGELPQDRDARATVERLGLEPHPEGGWFRRIWTATTAHSPGRAAGSSIQYLLDADGASRWHRIDATELWVHVEGAAVAVTRWSPDEGLRTDVIGGPTAGSSTPQAVVQPHEWQAACAMGGWSLVVCVVVPEFSFNGFELAPPGWEPPGWEPPGTGSG